jgi:hypothetical protein
MVPALGVHRDLPRPPVDISQLEAHDLAAAQTEAGQQDQHGVVPAPDRGPAITADQQAVHVGSADGPGQRRIPSSDR